MRETLQIQSSPRQGKGQTCSVNADGTMVAILREDKVDIVDFQGNVCHQIEIETNHDIFETKWNSSGNILCVVYKDHNYALLWIQSTTKTLPIEIGFNDPSFLLWSPHDNRFILGTQKGNLIIYDVSTHHVETILGKHSDEITCGAWIQSDKFILGSTDGTVTVSMMDGQTLHAHYLSNCPLRISCASAENIDYIAVDAGSEIMFLSWSEANAENVVTDEVPCTISIPGNHGKSECHFWEHCCESILILTSSGYIVKVLNPYITDDDHKLGLFDHTIKCPRQCISSFQEQMFLYIDDGDDIRMLSYRDNQLEDNSIFTMVGSNWLTLSEDSNFLLAVSSEAIRGFHLHATSPYATCRRAVAVITSHRELKVVHDDKLKQLHVEHDPEVLGLGPGHVAVGNGKEVRVYDLDKDVLTRKGRVFHIEDYVKAIQINEKFLVVHSQAALHVFDLTVEVPSCVQFCQGGRMSAKCCIITDYFLIYGTTGGSICFVHLDTSKAVKDLELRHKMSIIHLCSNSCGTIVVFVDGDGRGYIYDMFGQDVINIRSFPVCKYLFWNQSYNNIFHVFDGRRLHSFLVSLVSIRGPQVVKLSSITVEETGQIKINELSGLLVESHLLPISCNKENLLCQSSSDGALVTLISPNLQLTGSLDDMTVDELLAHFAKSIALNCVVDACKSACLLDLDYIWRALGNKAIEIIDLSMAIFAFQKLKEVALVARLEELLHVEEKNLLFGHLALLFGDYDLAEANFLLSSKPNEALQMRCDSGQLAAALVLAKEYFPKDLKRVAMLLAVELEYIGDLKSSLNVLEEALTHCTGETNLEDNRLWSMIAITSLKVGNRHRALSIADRLRMTQLYVDLASIFEEQKDLQTAAELFELGDQKINAARLWIYEKDIERVSKLLDAPGDGPVDEGLCNQYALLLKNHGKCDKAIKHYMKANNFTEAIRTSLHNLEDASKALSIMRDNPTKSIAIEASELCKTLDDNLSAIEFLALGEYHDEAFELAMATSLVDEYILLQGDFLTHKNCEVLGLHFERNDNLIQAAMYYSRSPRFVEKAYSIFVQNNAVVSAVKISHHNDHFARKLIEHFETIPKESQESNVCLYQLYLNVNDWSKAFDLSYVIIIHQMKAGQYQTAHDVACQTMTKVDALKVRIPSSLQRIFNTLHSYHLAKKFAKTNNHELVVTLLMRVSNHVELFAEKDHFNLHVSTIIECQKCGLNDMAYRFSKKLCSDKSMKEELEKSTYKRKIHSIIRRFRADDREEQVPHKNDDSTDIDDTVWPVCICSGKVLHPDLEWTFCPVTGMPGLFSEYREFLGVLEMGVDPISGKDVKLSELKKASTEDMKQFIKVQYAIDA